MVKFSKIDNMVGFLTQHMFYHLFGNTRAVHGNLINFVNGGIRNIILQLGLILLYVARAVFGRYSGIQNITSLVVRHILSCYCPRKICSLTSKLSNHSFSFACCHLFKCKFSEFIIHGLCHLLGCGRIDTVGSKV